MEIYRQGDVLIIRDDKTPLTEAKPLSRDPQGRIVLAYGEATGHAHAISDPEVHAYQLAEQMLLDAKKSVTLRHEEHAPIVLPAGRYRVIQQREYAPEAFGSSAYRFVAD